MTAQELMNLFWNQLLDDPNLQKIIQKMNNDIIIYGTIIDQSLYLKEIEKYFHDKQFTDKFIDELKKDG